jgi:hypothetical protein
MLYLGQCLTVGLIPAAVAIFSYYSNADEGNAAYVLCPIFLAGLVCLLGVGIWMLVRRHQLVAKFDPNAEDAEARIRYGQSRAALLSEQEAADVLAQVREQERLRLENQPPPAPIGNESQVASGLAGCLGLLVLIGIGVVWWNLWQASLKNETDEEIRRKFNHPPVLPAPLPPPMPLPELPQR